MNRARYERRKLNNTIFLLTSLLATAFGLSWLLAILGNLLISGITHINLDLFTKMTPPPPGEGGGLANAIVGSLIMSAIAVAIGTPVGILAGTWLAEYGRYSRFAQVVRSLNDILLSAPSIVIGLFVYELIVATTHHFSGFAGACALAFIVIPIVLRQTETMLLLVPNSLREATSALGAPTAFIVQRVIWRSARAGIITGVLLAIARISGETAPLLFTALNNAFWSTDLNAPMASVPVVIFQMAVSPYKGWHELAWAGALLITATVLLLSVIARIIGSEDKHR
ncbi:MAG: phosphate ABC transporter permease PstA [Alphaproteobacteria bacterium]|nr:phosphate ABC transporter permease PstA [Alphaproteobacteria bacterium]